MDKNTSADQREQKILPPTALRVAQRMLVLGCVLERGWIESAAIGSDGSAPDLAYAELQCGKLLRWMTTLDLEGEFEPQEKDLVLAPAGALSEQQVVDATWRAEGIGVLAWAVQRFDLPPYDEFVDLSLLAEAMQFLKPGAAQLLTAPGLRSCEELEQMRRSILALHWRLVDFRIRPHSMDFATFVCTAWFGPLTLEGLRLQKGDLALHEYSIAQAPPELYDCCASIAVERHTAINWLCGTAELYSDVTTDT